MNSNRYRLEAERGIDLKQLNPKDTGGLAKENAEERTSVLQKRLSELQEKLFAEKKRGLLIILQGMDCSGKDSTIKHLSAHIHPQGFKAVSFKKPTAEEMEHDFLWRVHDKTPGKGHIAAFNRSHYEDVLVPRAHGRLSDEDMLRRMAHINEFERLLTDEGTAIIKLFLHLSKERQLEKIEDRMHNPRKQWKFDIGDLEEREYWDAYQAAYERIFERCSASHAPWYWVPADHKWARNLAALEIVVDALERLKPEYPEPDASLTELQTKLQTKI